MEHRVEQEAEEQKQNEEKREKEQEKIHNEEASRVSTAIKAANNGQNNARIVENILGSRQDEEIASLQAKWDRELELQLAEIDKLDCSSDVKETKKKQLMNRIQLLHSNELIEMKNRHYQEKLDILTEVAPATAQQVELDKQNYEQTLQELEIKKRENDAKREKERLEWEENEKMRLAKEMEAFEDELERQLKEEKAKIEDELKIKSEQQAQVHNKQKELMEAELKSKVDNTSSENEKAKLVNDFNDQLNRVQDKSEQDKLRMNEQLRKRLEARKRELIDNQTEQLAEESEARKTQFENEAAAALNDESAATVKSKQPNEPLTAENVDRLLADSELCLTLQSIQKYLDIRNTDNKEYGELEPMNVSELSELELNAYNICLFLLDLLQQECGCSCTLQISSKVPKVDTRIEYADSHFVDGTTMTLKRSVLSNSTGLMMVILSYAFSRIMSSTKKTNLQSCFYQTQMIISDQIFKHMNNTN